MKFVYSLLLFFWAHICLWGAPVALLLDQGEQSHVLRNFERLWLSANVQLHSRDVFIIEKGVAAFDLQGSRFLIGAPGKVRFKQDTLGFQIEVFSGEVFLDVPHSERAWKVKFGEMYLRGGEVELFASMGEKDLELSVLKGSVQWMNRWVSWSAPLSNHQVLLTSTARMPQYAQAMTVLSKEVYGNWLLPTHLIPQKQSNGLSNLDGNSYDPRFEMLDVEEQRRKRIVFLDQLMDKRGDDFGHLKFLQQKDFHRDIQESLKEVQIFEFPDPLAPPPP
jgi:hypothetical protein